MRNLTSRIPKRLRCEILVLMWSFGSVAWLQLEFVLQGITGSMIEPYMHYLLRWT